MSIFVELGEGLWLGAEDSRVGDGEGVNEGEGEEAELVVDDVLGELSGFELLGPKNAPMMPMMRRRTRRITPQPRPPRHPFFLPDIEDVVLGAGPGGLEEADIRNFLRCEWYQHDRTGQYG